MSNERDLLDMEFNVITLLDGMTDTQLARSIDLFVPTLDGRYAAIVLLLQECSRRLSS